MDILGSFAAMNRETQELAFSLISDNGSLKEALFSVFKGARRGRGRDSGCVGSLLGPVA